MKKGIILTYADITEEEKTLLTNTNIYKIALNQHAEELKPNIRIIADYTLKDKLLRFPQKIISVRERLLSQSDRVIYPDIEFKGSTILAALDWLIKEGFSDILILGDNKVNSLQFQDEVKAGVNEIKDLANLYQYSDGNFDLPIISVNEFLE